MRPLGFYLLHRLQEIIEKEKSGLYRDDGLLVVEGGGQKAERMKKKLFSLFKSVGLKITAEANLKSVNFLDVNLDLADGTFKPFMKPNSKVKYVSRESNHPPLILKHIPEAVNERLERVSSCKQKFEEELLTYQKALTEAGYNHSLNYLEKVVDKSNITQDTHKRKRSRQVIWFNPPYSSNIKTNIGKAFFGILKKHFPDDSELSRLFNKKSVKISYSCMPSMQSLISGHNKKMLRGQEDADRMERRGCNCRGGLGRCPLSGKCQTKSLVYRAEVNSVDGSKEYLGQASNTFKLRYNGHTDSFRNEKKKKETTLSHYLWKLKGKEVETEVKWSIASLARPYSRETKKCQLCNMEKTLIACQDQDKGLNRRGELMTRCRHRDKHILTNWVTHHHPQLEEDTQAAAHVPTEQDEADVPSLSTIPSLSTVPSLSTLPYLSTAPSLSTVEHHLPQLPEHLLAEGHDEGPQDETSDPPLTAEGGPMTRSRTRARNRYMP